MLYAIFPVGPGQDQMQVRSALAMRPFQVSALFVQPHSHMRTGGGSTRRSLSYVCKMSSTRPAGQTL